MLENTVATVDNAEVVEVKNSSISVDFAKQLINKASELNNAEIAVQVNSEYMEFAKAGEKVRGVFIGLTQATFKDQQNEGQYKNQDAVQWMGSDKKVKICAAVALVNEIKRANIQPGTALEIEMTGKEGNTKLFNVSILAL
jgi:hypothetical protein